MIFVTVGSQKFQFNRLLRAVDTLVKTGYIQDKVFAQIGYSDYKPKYFSYKRFLNREQFANYENKADIVITHGGTGAIVGAVKKGKKVIAIPRLSQYNEHVDNHQTQIISIFKKNNLIYGLSDCDKLNVALHYVKNHKFNSYTSNTHTIISSIEKFIRSQLG